MWPIVLYTIYKLSNDGTKLVKVKDVVELVHDKLWFRHRIALFISDEEVIDIIKNLAKSGIIEILCKDNDYINCTIKVKDRERCKSIATKTENYFSTSTTLLGLAFDILKEELLRR